MPGTWICHHVGALDAKDQGTTEHPNTRKQDLTVRRSVSVCSVLSVVRKSDNDARHLDMPTGRVSAPIREPKSDTMVRSDSLPFLSDKAS